MSTELIVQNGSMNLAEAMGFSESAGPISNLYNLSLVNTAITAEIDDEEKIVVPVGGVKLSRGKGEDAEVAYSKTASMRIMGIRYQWQQWDQNLQVMHKTLMANNLKMDLKDTRGGFNLGRPSGYIKDYSALPESTQAVIRSVKRTMIIFGVIKLAKPVNEMGAAVDGYDDEVPFTLNLRNTDSIKAMEAITNKFRNNPMQLPEYYIDIKGKKEALPSGGTYATLQATVGQRVGLCETDVETFNNFLDYIARNNDYVQKKWDEAQGYEFTAEDAKLVSQFIDVEEFE